MKPFPAKGTGNKMENGLKKYDRYLCLFNDEADPIKTTIGIVETLEGAKAWQARHAEGDSSANIGTKPTSDITPAPTEIKSPQSPPEQLAELMGRFHKSISGYQILTTTSMAVLPIMQSFYIQSPLIKDAKKNFDTVHSDGDYTVFGLDPTSTPILNSHLYRIDEMRDAGRVLPGAILLSLVATFDSLIVETISIMLKSRPDRFNGSTKTLTISEVLSMKSFEEVINKIVEDEIIATMKDSHQSQIEYIEKNFNISFPKTHDRWGSFMEIFERRNLVAHGDLIVNDIYLSNCNKVKYDISKLNKGDSLKLGQSYLLKSSDILIEFGIELICLLWKKNFSSSVEGAYEKLSDIAYELIASGRSRLASRLLEFAIVKSKPLIKDRLLKMMTINLANAYRNNKERDKCKNLLDGVDWSATVDDFKICIASLNDDIDTFVNLMPKVADSGLVTKQAFRVWPVFEWVRSDERVSLKFFEIYGEDLTTSYDGKTQEISKLSEDISVAGHS